MTSLETIIDAAEFVLEALESSDDVAYAEVGGVHRDKRDVVVRGTGSNSATPIEIPSVWWRVFTDGSAAYRHTSTLVESHLTDLIERTIRSSRLLSQDVPARFDRGSVHRATHPGWGREGRLDELELESVTDRLDEALEGAAEDLKIPLSRSRITYTDERDQLVFLTTTGTTLYTTMERVQTESVLVTESGKVQEHAGSTTGRQFLRPVSQRTRALASRLDRLTEAPSGTIDDGRYDIALSPAAAASLFHQLSHYLEMDTIYLGSSPLTVGDQLGPTGLTIEDVVRPGCITARPFDAEGRPTQPVTLVADGTVVNRIHDTASAVAEEAHPSGNVIPSMGYDDPARIHARHLDVASGTASLDAIRAEAEIYIEQVGQPRFGNEATRTKRTSTIPPNTLYAKDVGETTPSEFEGEADDQWFEFPVQVAYTLDGSKRDRRIPDLTLVVSLSDVPGIRAMSAARATATGNCSKHQSMLPWAATAPAIRFEGRLESK